MVLTHDLHGRRVRVMNGGDRQGKTGIIQGVSYADNEVGIRLWVELDNDGSLQWFEVREVRLTRKESSCTRPFSPSP